MPVEQFANLPSATVVSGGTAAPAAGTQETWTVASSASFPAASSSATPQTQFHVTDQSAGKTSEIIAVTNVSGTTWTVTRGAENTTPVAHTAGFTVVQVVTAGWLTTLSNGAPVPVYAVQTSGFTIAAQGFYPVDASSGSVSAQLPTAPADGYLVTVKMINTNQQLGYTVSALPGGGDVFNSAGNTAPRTLVLLNQAIALQYQAANSTWYILSEDLPLTQLKNTLPDWLNVKNWGATGNGKLVTDAGITATGSTLTSSSANFTSGDVGKIGVIMGAGALNGSVGIPLPFTITGFTSSTQVTISATATTAVSNAVCYYGTDDQAKISATIAQTPVGGTAFLPSGIYLMSSELSIQKVMRLTGNGATIVTTNSAGINFGNVFITAASGGSTTTGLEIDHLVFDCSGGHVFYNTNWNKARLHDLRLVQRSYNFAVFYSTTSSNNQLDFYVDNVITRVNGAPRTVQAWYVLSSIGGGMAMCKWQNCLWQNNDGDTTQWYCEFDCTGTHNYTNLLTFDNCWFDRAFGGCIKLLSVQAATFHDCNIIDSFTQTIDGSPVSWGSNSAYYIGAYPGGSNWASQKVSFIDCSRDLQGPTGSSAWDIECESTSDTITVQNYLVRDIPGVSTFQPQFNFHGCTNVVIVNCPDAVITNSGTSQVALGPSGNVSFTGTLTGATQPPVPLPSDAGYIAWTFDPTMVAGTTIPASQTLLVAAVYIRTAQTISNIVVGITNSPVLTNAFVGLYQNNGTLLSGCSDQGANWTANGFKTTALTTPQSVGAGWYWVGLLTNFASTGASVIRGSNQTVGSQLAANAGSSGGSRRYAQIASFGTSLASFSTGSLADPTFAWWAAVK